MLSTAVLYTTATLLALVAGACTALFIAWSVPAWRRRLASPVDMGGASASAVKGLSGWCARVGGVLISAGIGAVAIVAWVGFSFALSAI